MQAQKIIKIRKVGTIRTKDIEVNNSSHVFYANNIAVSNSHAMGYAMIAYMSAYAKTHFRHAFFTSYLFFAKDKQRKFDEVKLLITNAKVMDVDVCPPDFRKANKHFQHIDDKIYFGFADIKGVGESSMKKLHTSVYQVETALNKSKDDWCWLEFLVYFSQEVSSTTITGMIEAGALDYMHIPRMVMLFEYENYTTLTKKEQAWIKQNVDPVDRRDLKDILYSTLLWYDDNSPYGKDIPKPMANKNRVIKARGMIELLIKPPYSLVDTPDWIARVEEARLGIPITASILDSCKNVSQANCTCLDFIKHKEINSGIFLAVQIDEVKTYIAKNDKEMAFVTISDLEASLDAVIFAGEWDNVSKSGICIPENTVMVSGDRSNKGGLIIKKMWQLT